MTTIVDTPSRATRPAAPGRDRRSPTRLICPLAVRCSGQALPASLTFDGRAVTLTVEDGGDPLRVTFAAAATLLDAADGGLSADTPARIARSTRSGHGLLAVRAHGARVEIVAAAAGLPSVYLTADRARLIAALRRIIAG